MIKLNICYAERYHTSSLLYGKSYCLNNSVESNGHWYKYLCVKPFNGCEHSIYYTEFAYFLFGEIKLTKFKKEFIWLK